jgi:cob(I)alamin adenosyltransferase
MRRGYIQVYTGNGKGKTTAALGLSLRAAGAGHKVFFAQFIKTRRCSEHKALERFGDLVTVRQYGRGFIIKRRPGKADIAAAQKGLEELRDIVSSGSYDLVILDEINVAVHQGLVTIEDLLQLMGSKHRKTELVITGRYVHEKAAEAADLVTEMKPIKHYANKGVKARLGIEK